MWKNSTNAARGTIAQQKEWHLKLSDMKNGGEIYHHTRRNARLLRFAQQPVMGVAWKGVIGDKAVSEFMEHLIEIAPADTQTVGTSVNVSGDRTNVVPYIVIIVLLVLALAVVLIKLKKNNKEI